MSLYDWFTRASKVAHYSVFLLNLYSTSFNLFLSSLTSFENLAAWLWDTLRPYWAAK
jgi:hypothetical protein